MLKCFASYPVAISGNDNQWTPTTNQSMADSSVYDKPDKYGVW